ncbi:TetR family transcriptional regulator [Umezawaea sp. Da 62-37]|uniref:TetR/AcrR family transcriptional regulator n=1 Tax=Umezawaea sp. Da 62-37 TaxID=3075927 RepID=UPI0028F73C93|nr:TetR family transcriptional regulator [Umezawaea sp. Da 62-37]WNV89760.1 TetR family transcriptional regulator [Umezawaea sp. Da 62-37]
MSDPEPKPTRRRPSGRADTRDRLIDSTIDTLRSHGIAGTSARTIAAAAGVNQALIFYHFEGMDGLLAEACRRTTERRVARYRDRFATVGSLRDLLAAGRDIHTAERAEGNIAVLAQLLAAGQTDPVLGKVTADSLNLWVAEIEAVLTRLLRDSPLSDLVDPPSLSRAVSAAFIGLELYEGVDAEGGGSALEALDQLGALVEVVEELGPLARRALRSRVRKATTQP